jgi:hypothetical protein
LAERLEQLGMAEELEDLRKFTVRPDGRQPSL